MKRTKIKNVLTTVPEGQSITGYGMGTDFSEQPVYFFE
jgi:hypothetical protein